MRVVVGQCCQPGLSKKVKYEKLEEFLPFGIDTVGNTVAKVIKIRKKLI